MTKMDFYTTDNYNKELEKYINDNNYQRLNYFVMTHTASKCKTDMFLQSSIKHTLLKQYIVFEEDTINAEKDGPTTNIVVSRKRSFEAAKAYMGKKVAVLNFANNHSPGGAPYSAGAQEESLCRTSTLYECLLNETDSFYEYHKRLYDTGKITNWGNDDLIYSPEIVVFKTDESAPMLMDQKDWYKVDVITCAAPEFRGIYHGQHSFDWRTRGGLKRLRKVFEVAKKEKVEVLILGAWGCGAFGNPPKDVALAFKELCNEYCFDTIEFAIDCSRGSTQNFDVFNDVFKNIK